MSSHQELFEAQQILNTLFHTGHRISRANVDYLMRQLNDHTNRMININHHNINTAVIIPDTEEGQISLTGPMTAPLRSNPTHRYNPLEKTRIIARKKLEDSCPTECAICQETPKHKDAVLTECNHYYCKGCWQSWMNTERSNKKCPTCRKDMPRITAFKARATKLLTGPASAPIRRPIIIEDDDI